MPSHPAMSMRRSAVNALDRAKKFSRNCAAEATPSTESVESTVFETRMLAIFETRLHARMKRGATDAVNTASMNVIAAFINDAEFVVSHNKQKIALRMLRNPRRESMTDWLVIAACPASASDDAESDARTETIHRAVVDTTKLTATVTVPGFARVCIGIPLNGSGEAVVGGDVFASVFP